MTNRNERLRQLAAAWNDAWNGGDPEALAAFFGDAGTYYEPDLLSGPVAGRTGVVQSATKTWQQWPGATFEIVSMIVADPHVALEWRSSAKHRSGVELTLEGVDILQWEGEKLAAARIYYDEHKRKLALAEQ